MIEIDRNSAKAVMDKKLEDVAQFILTRSIKNLNAKEFNAPNEYQISNTGLLSGSGHIFWEVDGVVVEFTMPYSVVVEFGGRPHRPPIYPIREWAKRRMRIRNKRKLDRISWAVANAISKNGTKGKKFLGSAIEEAIARWGY